MKFYDLLIQSNISGAESGIGQIVEFAEKLGYAGIAICDNYQGLEKLEEARKLISEIKSDVEVYQGVNIVAQDVNEMKEIVSKVREKVNLVIVSGGDYAINRSTCDDSRVDILMHPELNRSDSGLDEPSLEAAAHNNVAIGISFREIMFNFRKPRAYILNHIAKNLMLCDHFRTPFVICSCAQSIWGMRSPREFVSAINVLGLDISKAFASATSTPQNIVEGNRKTMEGSKVTEGVEEVE
ncbi:MAG: RNase P subunit p30 family protein [Candidatus Aenigmatarchaeota archaeon]